MRPFPLLVALAFCCLGTTCGGSSSTPLPLPPLPGAVAQAPVTLLLPLYQRRDRYHRQPGAAQAPVTLLLRDTPPAGITVLTFELTISGASLRNSTGGDVPLSATGLPVSVEMKNLESTSFFLGTGKIPVGTYTGSSITVTAVRMTILNNTGATIGACANGAVCEFTPSTNAVALSYAGAPFPLTIQANQPIGLELDFNLAAAIAQDLSLNLGDPNVLKISNLVPRTGDLAEIEDVFGRIVSRNTANKTFIFQVGNTGSELTLQVDANTRFERFDALGFSNSFDSLLTFFLVDVDYRVLADGTLVACRVELADNRQEGEVDGIVLSNNPFQNFQMVVVEMSTAVTNARVGAKIDVFDPGFTHSFAVDEDGFPITPDLQFRTGLDFLPGQRVQIRPQAIFPIPPALTARQRLRATSLTARVKSASGDVLIVDNLPGLLTGAGINEVEVRTASLTRFENVSGVASLLPGDAVSLRGLLFKGTTRPVLLARLVRKR